MEQEEKIILVKEIRETENYLNALIVKAGEGGLTVSENLMGHGSRVIGKTNVVQLKLNIYEVTNY